MGGWSSSSSSSPQPSSSCRGRGSARPCLRLLPSCVLQVPTKDGMLDVFYKSFEKARIAGFTKVLATGESGGYGSGGGPASSIPLTNASYSAALQLRGKRATRSASPSSTRRGRTSAARRGHWQPTSSGAAAAAVVVARQ